MKLLQAVVRFCGARARAVSGRGAVAVPRDFRVTVPASLAKAHAVDGGASNGCVAIAPASASLGRKPATAQAALQH